MKKNIIFQISLFLLTATIWSSCVNDLNTIPIDKKVTVSEVVFEDEGAYQQFLAKIYAGLALTGNKGPDGQGDVDGIDEGYSSYTRLLFYLNTLTTDEAICGWDDKTLLDLHRHKWTSTDIFVKGIYYRLYNEIGYCNEFIRETEDKKLDARNVSESIRQEIPYYRAEARFVRALCYSHLIDLFGSVGFVTDQHTVGSYIPKQESRAYIFNFIEQELIECATSLKAPFSNQYGRVDQASAWFLLSRLYLNAEVYTGTARWSDCITWSEKFKSAGYELAPNYRKLFSRDNEESDCQKEIIFVLPYDGVNSSSWGGIKYLITGAMGTATKPQDYGLDEAGWAGPRSTSALIDQFGGTTFDKKDLRTYAIVTAGSSYENKTETLFADGYTILKWSNLPTTDNPNAASYPPPSDAKQPDTDLAWFRLSEVYLNEAEARLRINPSDPTALSLVNQVRVRAYGGLLPNGDPNAGKINSVDLDFILSERSRELFWESSRRTDLIRHGQFTNGSYRWPWKGGVKAGTPTESWKNIFPIPASDLAANQNLKQNNPQY